MKNKVRMIAIYGKGGIGKSTISANLSIALSQMGEKVMQVGCDPKRDSVAMLLGGKLAPTILGQTLEYPSINEEVLKEVIFQGCEGVICCESGGPRPGTGCAGRGVVVALELLDKYRMFDEYDVTFVIFDILGDTVCGGFAEPMRRGFAKEVYIITNAELLSLYQGNNIAKSVKNLHDRGVDVGVAGLIDNQRNIPRETEIVEKFGEIIGVPVIHHIPRSETVQNAEFQGKTVVEAYPQSKQAEEYRILARKILQTKSRFTPKPTDLNTLYKIMEEALK